MSSTSDGRRRLLAAAVPPYVSSVTFTDSGRDPVIGAAVCFGVHCLTSDPKTSDIDSFRDPG
ncbi:hypothetical protein [Streptomyces cacaoi]|uniref:hypothetical protein n=1 Tax=Streptomyces cacaoi TaxID=1898 RepID=UPI003747C468